MQITFYTEELQVQRPQERVCLACSRNTPEASRAGAECARRKAGEAKVSGGQDGIIPRHCEDFGLSRMQLNGTAT